MLLACLAGAVMAADRSVAIVPTLSYPAGEQSALQPTGLYVDTHTNDVYVVDASTSRIAIYDADRQYNFEFSTRDRLVSPRQVAVDAQGRIFVLGDTREHTLAVFDYNGEFLRYFDLTDGTERLQPAGIALDAQDQLHVLTTMPLQVHVFSADAAPVRDYFVFTEGDSISRFNTIIGNFAIYADEIVLPFPVFGNVSCFDLTGKLTRSIGTAGGGPGELSFPIAGVPLKDGGFAIVDKHRHLVQFFRPDGRFEFEAGGAGLVAGWFFHPTSLVACADGTLLVGQTYGDRVQALAVQTASSGS